MRHPSALALVRDEMADHALYTALRRFAAPDVAPILDEFIATETRHIAYWRAFFRVDEPVTLGLARRAQLGFFVLLARLGGASVTLMLLEAIEVHGVRKYLRLWQETDDPELRKGLRGILEDELKHEDETVSASSGRRVNADTVRNAFLGFNDGSVEILGAVNGLAAAFSEPSMVAAAGLTVSAAGALSMAVGAFLSTEAEGEVRATEEGKRAFLDGEAEPASRRSSPWGAAALVGSSYLVGAAVPVAPFLFGATHAYWSILFSGALILCVTAALSFLSGMRVVRRLALNGALLAGAVVVAYAIGRLADHWLVGA